MVELSLAKLPAYDPSQDPKLPWEDQVEVVIEKLRAEKAAKQRKPR